MSRYLIECSCGAIFKENLIEGDRIEILCDCGKKIVINEYVEECKI